jgi:hypothetical protein
MRFVKIILGIVLVLVVVYFVGPHPSKPIYDPALPTVPTTAVALEQYISQEEAKHQVKKDNEAKIVARRKRPMPLFIYTGLALVGWREILLIGILPKHLVAICI